MGQGMACITGFEPGNTAAEQYHTRNVAWLTRSYYINTMQIPT